MMESNVGIGRRVECDGHRGTIHWIGELPPAQGTWYGIDWDDASRGRHDGSHNNIKYFQTRYPTSGSFVRPAKVNTGITFEKAIRGRYQDDATVESEVMEQLQREINARFVEVVGMDKVGRKQSILEELGTAGLTGWMIWGTDEADLTTILPRLHSVDVSNSLLSSWIAVADIARQLPRLRFLNVSGNMLCIPDHPEELKKSLNHVVHLVLNNMLVYSWMDLLTCCTMFPELRNLQVAFNKLDVLGPIPCGVFDCLEELDIGENPISSWEEICHLGSLPRLESLNANSCCLKRITFPSTSATDKTPLFPHLERLMLANNPLDTWECTGELNKLSKMEYLVISYNVKTSRYFQEFTFARISKLKVLNRTELSPKEKRDCELFYLKTFSSEYYKNGGKEDQNSNSLSQEFIEKHPTYLRLIKAHGAPLDDTDFKTQKSQKLKDLKVELKIIILSEPQREETFKFFLLTTKVAKVKMMLKRHLKINPSTNLKLSYCSTKDGGFEIPMDNDQQDLAFYSVENGDVLLISL
ncbi:tubulin-specific chaperone E-like isoform X1 [Scylla paramamosain]|uniref:tubulin-specific chaperone E-like isoform X1 n=1 Tax=Scylla paramamosain TaxID=85552 RepID=UPI0030839DF1